MAKMEEARLVVGGVNRGRPKKNVKKDANLQGKVGDYNSLDKAQIFKIFWCFWVWHTFVYGKVSFLSFRNCVFSFIQIQNVRNITLAISMLFNLSPRNFKYI
jgi:hypothetical protein